MSHFSVAVVSKAPQDIEELLAPYQEGGIGECPSEYLSFYPDEDCDIDDITGKKGCWINPNARWDWYEIGGRWSNLLKLKNGKISSSAKIKDIDFSRDDDKYKSALRFWEVAVEGYPLHPSEDPKDFSVPFSPKYFRLQYKSKEEYASYISDFHPWALLTPDGDWYERGEMGWFGLSDATVESHQIYTDISSHIINETDPEYYITIVDCHI